MFYSLTGQLIYQNSSAAVISCGGVAFRCFVTATTLRSLPQKGSEVTLFTHLNVKEDALDLYGFFEESELELFKLLNTVSGVGPKAALAILSELSPERLVLCIATSDIKAITNAQGVGMKTAQRVVLELKDKVGSVQSAVENDDMQAAGAVSASTNAADAVSALVSLGYSRSEASLAVGRLDGNRPAGQLIREALKTLGKK